MLLRHALCFIRYCCYLIKLRIFKRRASNFRRICYIFYFGVRFSWNCPKMTTTEQSFEGSSCTAQTRLRSRYRQTLPLPPQRRTGVRGYFQRFHFPQPKMIRAGLNFESQPTCLISILIFPLSFSYKRKYLSVCPSFVNDGSSLVRKLVVNNDYFFSS